MTVVVSIHNLFSFFSAPSFIIINTNSPATARYGEFLDKLIFCYIHLDIKTKLAIK